jgi:hypothetical protein
MQLQKIVGQQLFDKYVAPVVNSTPVEKTLSYSEYYEQFNKKD